MAATRLEAMLDYISFKLPKDTLLDVVEGFAKQPDGFGIGDALSQIEPQQPHEG
ncbi:MAG: hypothetical protein NPIRA06_33930 [Nitrospirales bacterium]|nr:MAG: hypothetical protein NPIRA06_33930 [Nitrospirales bacterium]